LNLLITCGRNFESEAENEIKKILNECDDQEPKIHKTNMRGILFIDTNADTTEIIDWVKKKITEEPWFVRYCLRMIPIQLESDTDIEKIKQNVQKLKNIIQKFGNKTGLSILRNDGIFSLEKSKRESE
jgi:tRNA acetyltransferase TAN1